MTRETAEQGPGLCWEWAAVFPAGCRYEDGCGELTRALAGLDAFLAAAPGLAKKGAGDIRLVCDEVIANVLRHGCAEKDVRVDARIEVRDGTVLVTIADDGPEFDLYAQADPYTGEDLDKHRIGGFGLYFIRQLFPAGHQRREGGRNVCRVALAVHHKPAPR